jgi:hypothetical protein
MSLRWREAGLIVGTILFVLGTIAAAVLLVINIHWTYKLTCSYFEGSSLDCLDSVEYRDGQEWTWGGYSTALGLAITGGGLIYLSSTPKPHRTPVERKALDGAAILWTALIIAGFACLFSGYYLNDSIDPLWGWQNWYVYVLIHGLKSVPWLLWVMALGMLFILRSEWVISRRRSEERIPPA